MLLVTHDVDEALQLADRIIVLKGGQFALDVRLARGLGRDRADAAFVRQRKQLLQALGVEADSKRIGDMSCIVDNLS